MILPAPRRAHGRLTVRFSTANNQGNSHSAMAISKKRKRRIIVRSRPFLWWAFDEHDQAAFDGLQVKIVAEDQSLFLQYGLAQSADRRFLVIGLRHDAAVLHVRCPAFESSPGRVQPSDIHTLIDWAASMPPECAPDDVVHAHSSKEEVPGGDRATRVYGAVLEEVHRCLSTAAP